LTECKGNILDSHCAQEQRHLILDTFVDKRHGAADRRSVEYPSKTEQTCDLENLSLEGLSQRDFLVGDILLELCHD